MRIIAGEFKGRRLADPGKAPLRPTSDSLRETLFNVLGPAVREARVLDAYAGTGALGLEALSRGASHATFIESDRRSLSVLRENISRLGVEARCSVVQRDFMKAPDAAGPFDLVFLDPPYDVEDPMLVVDRASRFLDPSGRLVLEHSRRRESAPALGALARTRMLLAGDSALSFYERS